MMNKREKSLLDKLLKFRELNKKRTISFMFNRYGLSGFVHSADGNFVESFYVDDEGSVEQAIQKVKEYEQSCKEKLEEQKSAISCDAEPSGTTVGTNA